MNTFRQITSRMPEEIESVLCQLPESEVRDIEEIRMRCGQEILLRSRNRELILKYKVNARDLQQTLNHLIQYSYYAYEEDLAKGFVTIEGGHRVGICGRIAFRKGMPAVMKEISSMNIRFAKEIRGCSRKTLPEIIENSQPLNTLIVSPPGCGKTTLLRDLARELSENRFHVAICDERSELAGMYQSQPSFDLGPRCDILDGCDKSWGIPMLIRSMAPQVIITDEIGKPDDVPAALQCLASGITLITSIHGSSMDDVKRSSAGPLTDAGIFKRILFLTNKGGAGTVKEVVRLA